MEIIFLAGNHNYHLLNLKNCNYLFKLLMDYEGAKLMRLGVKDETGFIGMVLNKSVNAEYMAAKALATLEETDEEINALI